MWGLTKIVVEGDRAKDVYGLLCRAKEECGREECGYRSEIISAGDGQYRFAFGMYIIVKYESEDDIFGPSTVTEVVRPDVFMLLPDPDDEESRYVTQFGKIEFDFVDSVLKVSEADYIGETNDQEGKYFNLEFA